MIGHQDLSPQNRNFILEDHELKKRERERTYSLSPTSSLRFIYILKLIFKPTVLESGYQSSPFWITEYLSELPHQSSTSLPSPLSNYSSLLTPLSESVKVNEKNISEFSEWNSFLFQITKRYKVLAYSIFLSHFRFTIDFDTKKWEFTIH